MAPFVRLGQNSELLQNEATEEQVRAYAEMFRKMLGSVYKNLKSSDPIHGNGLICQPFYFGSPGDRLEARTCQGSHRATDLQAGARLPAHSPRRPVLYPERDAHREARSTPVLDSFDGHPRCRRNSPRSATARVLTMANPGSGAGLSPGITSGLALNTLVNETLAFIRDELPHWRDDPERVDELVEENLNLQLCKYLNVRARHDFPMAHFNHEEKQAPQRTIDLSATPDSLIVAGTRSSPNTIPTSSLRGSGSQPPRATGRRSTSPASTRSRVASRGSSWGCMAGNSMSPRWSPTSRTTRPTPGS